MYWGLHLPLKKSKIFSIGSDFPVEAHEDGLNVTIPARRWDIFRDADLNEEGRPNLRLRQLYQLLCPTGRQSIGILTPTQKLQRASRTALEGLGLTQAISYSLTTAEKAKMFMMRKSFETKLTLAK